MACIFSSPPWIKKYRTAFPDVGNAEPSPILIRNRLCTRRPSGFLGQDKVRELVRRSEKATVPSVSSSAACAMHNGQGKEGALRLGDFALGMPP
eukprot:scaffold3719_cov247-Pinguiococcus_pyrenoidosus.AAC.3